jgi:uncharacterized protein YggE
MTEPGATIAVRGSWTAQVPPERARVRISVGARSGDRAQALRDLTRRLDEVGAEVTGYGGAVESADTGTLWVHPQIKDGKPRERVTGYVAGAVVTVTVVDFAVLGDLLLRLADRDMVGLDGPFWELRPQSDAYRLAHVEAVRDARRRAEEYAAAAGVRLTGLVEIVDVGLSGDAGPVHLASAAFARAGGGSVAAEVSFDVQPVPQTVDAAVEVRFTCSQPEF